MRLLLVVMFIVALPFLVYGALAFVTCVILWRTFVWLCIRYGR